MTLRVLIIDDEPQLVRHIGDYLQSFAGEFQVSTAGSGEEGLEILSHEPFDVLLSDVRLPGIDGVEVVRRALADLPGLRVIVMTAFATRELRNLALGMGAVRFIPKPLDLEHLRVTLLEVGEEARGWSGRVGGLDIFDFTQLLAMGGKSKSVQVRFGRKKGVLIFENGTLVHASMGKLAGVEAFYQMAEWEGGSFQEVPGPKSETFPPNIAVSTTHLLMEAARLRDEKGQQAGGAVHDLTTESGAGTGTPTISQGQAPTVASEPARETQSEVRAMAVKEHLEEFRAVEGFRGAAVFTSQGEMLDSVTTGNWDIKSVGMFANNALLNAQKASDQMGVGRGNLMQIRAPKASLLMRCLNEATDFAQTAAGKAHFHTVVVIEPEGNVGMASMILEKVVGRIADEVR